MSDDLKRIADKGLTWREYAMAQGAEPSKDPWRWIATVMLKELRTMSPEMLSAAISTPWPDDMSAQDQVQAMFAAAIDAILEE